MLAHNSAVTESQEKLVRAHRHASVSRQASSTSPSAAASSACRPTSRRTLGPSAPIAYIVCALAMGLIVLVHCRRRQPCLAHWRSIRVRGHGLRSVRRLHLRRTALHARDVRDGGGVDGVRGQHRPAGAGAVRPGGDGAGAVGGVRVLVVRQLARRHARASRLNSIATVAKLLPLLLIAVGGVFFVERENLAIEVVPPAGDFARTSLFLIFAFAGVESALVPSGEVRDTARTVPAGHRAGDGRSSPCSTSRCRWWRRAFSATALAQATASPLADAAGMSMGGWARAAPARGRVHFDVRLPRRHDALDAPRVVSRSRATASCHADWRPCIPGTARLKWPSSRSRC